MAKGHYWIEPVDQTLNDFQFYKARIVGDPEYDEKHHRVILRTDKYFPVGSIFHVLNDKEMFVIERKFKIWGNKYVICFPIRKCFTHCLIWKIFKVNTRASR